MCLRGEDGWMERVSLRPGVFSRYDLVSLRQKTGGSPAFFCGGAKSNGDSGLEPGQVVPLSSLHQLEEQFSREEGGEEFWEVCRLLLRAGCSTVYAVPVTLDGSKPEDAQMKEALGQLERLPHSGVMVCGGSQGVLEELRQVLLRCAQAQKERMGVAAVAAEEAVETAKALNCERLVLCTQAAWVGESGSILYAAAGVAGQLAAAQPDQSFNGLSLPGLDRVEGLEEQRLEELMAAGVSVLEQGQQGVEWVRGITCRTTTGGEPDRTFAAVNVPLMLDRVMGQLRGRLGQLLRGSRALSLRPDAVGAQAAAVLEEQRAAGLLEEFSTPQVYRDEEDPAVCVVEVSFRLAMTLSQIYLQAQITL